MENTKQPSPNQSPLRESEERYHKMIAEVRDYAILLLDTDGNIQNWNLGAEHIKGYTESEILGRNFRLFYQDSDRAAQLPELLINEARTNGRAMHEGWRVRKDGTMFWGSVVITALHDEEGNVIGFSKVTRDLTERKLSEDRIQHYMRDIESRNKQLEEFAYIASHDLQEPLRKIQIFTEMLGNSLDDKETASRHLNKIANSAQRMSSLIKDVLKYSQITAADELFEPVDLNEVLRNIREDYDILLREKKVQLTATTLPIVHAVPVQMHQLFGNLIGNAIKFSRSEPAITIHARTLFGNEPLQYGLTADGKAYTRILVTDNGIGFEQHYAEQVFKIFKRLTENTGTGIGLALCKKIIENHGGYIGVVSEPGKGTEFTVVLPLAN